MRHTAKAISTVTSVAALLGALTFSMPGISIADEASDIADGKKLAFNKKKGNCLACHEIVGGKLPGNIGPPLISIKGRYDKSKLRAQISDARSVNPSSVMPPFGPHEILSATEIDKIVEFIHTL